MNNKSIAILLMSLSAAVLLIANIVLPHQARAEAAIKDRDYQLVTARIDTGSEALYVIDNRTGMVAVLSYDAASRSVVPRVVRRVADAFPSPAPAR